MPSGAVDRQDDRMQAAITFVRRTGASTWQLRYSDDDAPVVWLAVAGYPGGAHEVAAAMEPLRAALRLCEQLADGAQCTHCGRPCGFEPDSLDAMPANDLICWYQYDPGAKRYVQGCTK